MTPQQMTSTQTRPAPQTLRAHPGRGSQTDPRARLVEQILRLRGSTRAPRLTSTRSA